MNEEFEEWWYERAQQGINKTTKYHHAQAAYKAGAAAIRGAGDMIDANVIHSAIEQHVKDRHMGFDQSDSYWLRVFAGQAMQGVLASNTADTRIECLPAACVAVAKSLLEEVKRREADK